MKGLMLNNLYTTKKDKTLWVISAAVTAVLAVSFFDADLRLYFLTVFGFLSVVLFAKNGGVHIDAFPFSKAQIVADRYIWCLVGVGITLLTGAVSTVIRYFMIDAPFSIDEIYIWLTMLGVAVISASICIVLSFRFKPIVGLGSHGFFTGAFSGSSYNQETADDGTTIYTWADRNVMLVILAIAVVMFVLSWLLSLKIYKKRGVRA